MIRANRGVSPISVDNYGKLRNQLKPGERALTLMPCGPNS